MLSASGCGVDSNLKTSGIGRDLALVTWVGTGGSGPVEHAAEEAYASIDAALRERGCVPVQERVFGDLQAAPALARGRARAVGSSAEWAVPTTYVEGSPVGRAGLSGIHVVGARGTLPPPGRGRPGLRAGRGGRDGAPRRARGRGPAGVGAAGGRPGRGRGGRPRRGGGAAGPGGLLLPRRRAHLVLPAGHPGLVRPVQRRAQRRLPADGAHGTGRRRDDPREHGHRGAQPARRLVHPRPAGAAAEGRRPRADGAAAQPEAERGDRVRLGLRPGDGARPRRRALHLRLRHGLDRRPRRDRARGRLRDADALHARGGGGAARRARARASRDVVPGDGLPRRTPATAAPSSASSSGRRCGRRPSSPPSPTSAATTCSSRSTPSRSCRCGRGARR